MSILCQCGFHRWKEVHKPNSNRQRLYMTFGYSFVPATLVDGYICSRCRVRNQIASNPVRFLGWLVVRFFLCAVCIPLLPIFLLGWLCEVAGDDAKAAWPWRKS